MSYFFAGNATRLCDANGRWTGSEPKCQPIACGDPVTFPHTTVALINGSTSWKARAQYSCIFGYQPLNGNLKTYQRTKLFFPFVKPNKNIFILSECITQWVKSHQKSLIFKILRVPTALGDFPFLLLFVGANYILLLFVGSV